MSSSSTLPPQRGLFFEEIGADYSISSQGRTVTEADIVMFAGLSGDYNPIHTDEAYSQQTMFGGRIAHGLLGLSIASGLAMQLGFMTGTVEAFRELTWKFRKPIMIGDTIHIVAKVSEKKALRGYHGGLVTFEVSVVNHKGETAHQGTWTLLVKGKPA